jgi:hypothetical protein
MNILLSSALSQALGWSLFHFLWQGALIAAAAAVALKFAARAQTRYAIACAALIAMPAVFAITLRLSIPQSPTVIRHQNFLPTRPAAIPPLDPDHAARLLYVSRIRRAVVAGGSFLRLAVPLSRVVLGHAPAPARNV